MAQLTVANRMTPGFPGMMADSNMAKYVRSYANAETVNEIPFGVFVKQGATPNAAIQLDTVATDLAALIGVTVHSHAYHRNIEVGTIGMKPKTTMGVLRRGVIWVMCETAMAVNGPIFIRAVAAGAEVPGAVRVDADTADAFDASGIGRVVYPSSGAGVCQIEFEILLAA